jgi:NAD(P)-dependent dehydrogenase (short-subunit alcohol dehydrogenase family)
MDLKLEDDVAVVLGGARGLGLAIAEAFASEAASVVLVDRDPEVAQAAARVSGSREAIGLVADVTKSSQIEDAANRVREQMGRVDHVVFAAGIGSGKFGFPFWNLDPADWENVLRVNLLGGMHVAHAFAPRMAEARRGTMLFISSVAGQIGSQTDPPYSASKAGLINFAQCAAKDLAPFGVRVNTLCPGMVKTALNRSVFEAWAARTPEPKPPSYEEWAAEKIAKLVPLGRWQEVEDIAAMAVFLASPRAGNVTGQTINVDGGYVMHW